MAISWTKSWSSSDDGTVLGGADLGNIQDDVDTGTLTLGGTQTITGTKTITGTLTLTNLNTVIIVDGSTYAKTDAGIEAAMAALPATGGTVFLPTGTYTLTAAIDITKDGVVLQGAGPSTILSCASAMNDSAIVGNNVSDIIIRDLKIDGNGANQTGGSAIYIYGTSVNIQILDIWILDPYGNGIWAGGGANADIRISGCYVSGAMVDDGIMIHTAKKFAITNCIVRNTTSDTNNCIGIYASGSYLSGEGVISNCTTIGAANGISVEGYSRYVAVSNCYTTGATANGISVKDNAHYVTVIDCVTSGNTARGISITDTEDVIMSNCISSGNAVGIYAADSTRLSISNILTEGNTSDSAALGSGIHLSTVTDLLVINCHLNDGKTNGAYLTNTADGVFSSNRISGGATYGMKIFTSSNLNFTGNFSDRNQYGFYFTTCPDSNISNNKGIGIGGAGGYGIHIETSPRCSINSNHMSNYGSRGINITGTSHNCVINSNMLVDQQATKTQAGILINDNTDYCVVVGNQVKGYETDGVDVGAGTGHVEEHGIESAT